MDLQTYAESRVLITSCARAAGIVGDQQIQEVNDLCLLACLVRSGVSVFREVREPGGQDLQRNFTLDVSSVVDGTHQPASFRLLEFQRLFPPAKL